MRPALQFCFLFGWAIMLGCSQPAGDVSVPGNAEAIEDTESLEATGNTSEELTNDLSNRPALPSPADPAGEPQAAEVPPEIDYGPWLKLPEKVSSQLEKSYPVVVQSANAGDAQGQANLAVLSQYVASDVAGTDEDLAYRFILQSAEAVRKAVENGAQVPQSMIGQIYFNEASALAHQGSIDKATTALRAAVENGFSNFAALESESDLAEVRQAEGFAEELAQWKELAAEKAREHAREELAAGESFPFELNATDINGQPISLDALQGKVVIVDVWGTWCPPCRAEIPSFIKLQNEFAEQGFQMIGLNYERYQTPEQNREAVVKFVEEQGINYPCVLGEEETREQIPDFRGYPTTLFIDKTGKVRLKAVGLHEYSYLAAVVSELLAEES